VEALVLREKRWLAFGPISGKPATPHKILLGLLVAIILWRVKNRASIEVQLSAMPGKSEGDMPTIFSHCRAPSCAWLVSLSLALVINCAATVSAQVTQVYSFEPDLEGFHLNGGGLTVSQETSGLGATSGSNSMKLEYADFSSFAGPETENIHPAFNDPLGIDFVRFDLTNTNRFVPPNPQPGVTPTFADISVTFFGNLPGNPTQPAQIQFLLSQQAVGNLEPGIHQIDIDISNTGSPTHTGGGLNVDTGQVKGYNAWVALGFHPEAFEIYLNKNGQFGNPIFAWTIYVDNIRVGRFPHGVPGDYNGNGTVDAADYALWRKGGSLQNEVDTPGTVNAADYTEWRARFGNISGTGSELDIGSVPEPTSMVLFLVVGAAHVLGISRCRLMRDGDLQ
jgi:hypothetical protein